MIVYALDARHARFGLAFGRECPRSSACGSLAGTLICAAVGSDRGEFAMGSQINRWTMYRMKGTLDLLRDLTRRTLGLFPQLGHACRLRSWAGRCELTPGYSPLLGEAE